MEAKKTNRITIKSLSEEFKKETNYLKEVVKHLENKVNDQDTKIQGLEERLAQKTEVSVNCEISENVCEVCEKVLQSQILLKNIEKKYIQGKSSVDHVKQILSKTQS